MRTRIRNVCVRVSPGRKQQWQIVPDHSGGSLSSGTFSFPSIYISLTSHLINCQKLTNSCSFSYSLSHPVWLALTFSPFRGLQIVKSRGLKMSSVVDSGLGGDFVAAMNHLFKIPENIEKFAYPSRSRGHNDTNGDSSIPVDILDTPKEYVFHFDVPGLFKSDIQVTVEEENTLVIRSNGKRKREDGEEEGCKYIRLERRASQKLLRKFRLPENANVAAITAKCEDGVLTVVVEKLPPPPKSKTVEVTIA